MSSDAFGPLHPAPPIDVVSFRVGGPLRVGDEHPARRGWFYTGRFGSDGEPLWYKPPPRWHRAIFKAGAGLTLFLFYGGALGAVIGRPHWFDAMFMLALSIGTTIGFRIHLKEPITVPASARPSRRKRSA